MVEQEVVKKIEDFVYAKPRSIQEIAVHIEKNWRTADRYVDEIAKNFGTISSRVFREGTRGALKIVYWAAIDKVSYSVFQEQLEKDIMVGKNKYDFRGFDIFQHIDRDKKRVSVEEVNEEKLTELEELAELLEQTQNSLLIFSGNLSFINLRNESYGIFEILDKLIKRGVSMKAVCRVDIAGKENIEKLLSLNFKYGKELIEVRHREQPLRALVIDGKIFRLKEIQEPTCRDYELKKKIYIFYTFKDKDWIEWVTRIFWKMFNSSIDSKKRLEELGRIRV